MAHVIMSFGFEDGDHISWSVEVRREKTGEFSPVADAFRNHTLIYLATTERNSVRLRIERARRGRAPLSAQHAAWPGACAPVEYALQATALAAQPKWYNSITANCATVVFKIVRAAGGTFPLDWRLVVNGFLPGYLYDRRVVVTSMPLAELVERARDQRKSEGGGPVARLLAGHPRRRALAVGRGEVGSAIRLRPLRSRQ